jgi:hypothetical protein
VSSSGAHIVADDDLPGPLIWKGSGGQAKKTPLHHPRPVRLTERKALSDLSRLSSIGKTTPSLGKFDKPEEPTFAPDGVRYVSDGTWEERT